MPSLGFLVACTLIALAASGLVALRTPEKSAMVLEAEAALESFRAAAAEMEVERLDASKLQRLTAKYAQERDKARQVLEQRNRRTLQQVIQATSESSGDVISLDDLEEELDPDYLIEQSREQLDEIVETILSEEIERLSQQPAGSSSNCVSSDVAAKEMDDALTRFQLDQIGMKDHAGAGGWIVHSMTSDTYVPPPMEHQRLGSSWLRSFLPDDLEYFLPSGWEDWDTRVPTSLAHSLGWTGTVASPETILHPTTLPGACWPMKGAQGQVVVNLPYPVDVSAVSIDHASKILLSDPAEQLQSAPKKVQFLGYPPCDKDCNGLLFDPSHPVELAEGVFDAMEGSSVQTFAVEALDPKESEGSCAVDTCSGPPATTIAAVSLKVLENWGNLDYTCLYRIRVHGEPVVVDASMRK